MEQSNRVPSTIELFDVHGKLAIEPAYQLAKAIRSGEVSSLDIVEAYLAQIARYNPALKAFVTMDKHGARQRAQPVDEALARCELCGPSYFVLSLLLRNRHAREVGESARVD